MQKNYMGRLSDVQWATEAELKFITEAWLQIIDCVRIHLKLHFDRITNLE